MAQVLMHHQPGIEIQRKVCRQHSLQGNNAVGEGRLADADPCPGADQVQLGEVAIGAHCEGLALKTGIARKSPANEGRGAVETNQRVAVKLLRRSGPTLAGQIGIGSMQPKLDPAETPRDKLLLLRSDHPHRDIRLPVKQILKPIGEHQFDDDTRARLPEPGNQRRQHLGADHLAGGHPHHATQIGAVATKVSRRAFQRPGGVGHCLGVRLQRQRRVGRQQAGLRAGK